MSWSHHCAPKVYKSRNTALAVSYEITSIHNLITESLRLPLTTNLFKLHLKTRGCGRWGAARYGAVLAVEYVRAVLGLSRSFRSSARGQKLVRRTDRRTLPTGVAVGVVLFFANNAISRRDLDLWPLDLEIGPWGTGVPGTIPTKFGIRRPFRFSSRWRHGTDRQTDGQDQHMMGPPSRKDGPITTVKTARTLHSTIKLSPWALLEVSHKMVLYRQCHHIALYSTCWYLYRACVGKTSSAPRCRLGRWRAGCSASLTRLLLSSSSVVIDWSNDDITSPAPPAVTPWDCTEALLAPVATEDTATSTACDVLFTCVFGSTSDDIASRFRFLFWTSCKKQQLVSCRNAVTAYQWISKLCDKKLGKISENWPNPLV